MASFDRKAFLSLPTGSRYLECFYKNNHYSLNPDPSTHIFCARGLRVRRNGSAMNNTQKMIEYTEDNPIELLKMMDALGEAERSTCVDEPPEIAYRESLYRNVARSPLRAPATTQSQLAMAMSAQAGGVALLPSPYTTPHPSCPLPTRPLYSASKF
jgi:hypothetical protein